jgi:uncharacterized membrane protein YozB (DUF420 family)
VKECRVNALVLHILNSEHFFAYFILFCIFCIFYLLNYMFTYFQRESMMDAMLTTGMLRTIAPDPVFLFGLTAGTNKPQHQIPNRTAETLPAFEPTFGIARGFGVFSSTIWLVVEVTTWVTMHSFGKRYCMGMLASLVDTQV